MNTELLIQLLVNGLIVGTLYGVVAMSFVLIYKATQVVNFAQGEFLLIGAWVCWWLLTKYQLPFYLGMPITLAFMFAFGVALLVVGLLMDSKPARLASAAVVGLTTAKVFLIDLADLAGVWRALSFIGLGLVLVGIGYLYQRLLFPQRPMVAAPAPGSPQ